MILFDPISYIILHHINNACTHSILGCFMDIVDIQFAKDIFAMRGDCMKTQVTLDSYFLCRFTFGNLFENFCFSNCQEIFLFLYRLIAGI